MEQNVSQHSNDIAETGAGTLLEVDGLSMRFGGLQAVDGLNFAVGRGEIFAIIGPNGAGKTTVFDCIAGQAATFGGRVVFDGRNIAGRPAHRIARDGIARTFQNGGVFADLSVLENLLIAGQGRKRVSVARLLFRPNVCRREDAEAAAQAMKWLEFVGLQVDPQREAGSLPYGHRRLLEIARCLATAPQLLMLDEPAAGLNSQEKNDLGMLVERIRTMLGMTVVLIEHDMNLVMGISDRVLVMDRGRAIALGAPQTVVRDPHVVRVYLGEEE